MSTPEIRIWSDYICPFCRIAEERAAALEQRFGARTTWLPFDLHPEYPASGLPRQQLLDRYGPRMMAGVEAMFAEAGLPYRPHPDVIPNSRLALELGEQARAEGVHPAYHALVMAAYWTDGQDIGDRAVLAALARRAGVSPEGITEALEHRRGAHAVDAATRAAHVAGISSVPAFVIDDRLLVLGAQPHDVLADAVEHARRLGPASAVAD